MPYREGAEVRRPYWEEGQLGQGEAGQKLTQAQGL